MPRIALRGHAAQGGPAGVLDRDAVPDERWALLASSSQPVIDAQ